MNRLRTLKSASSAIGVMLTLLLGACATDGTAPRAVAADPFCHWPYHDWECRYYGYPHAYGSYVYRDPFHSPYPGHYHGPWVYRAPPRVIVPVPVPRPPAVTPKPPVKPPPARGERPERRERPERDKGPERRERPDRDDRRDRIRERLP